MTDDEEILELHWGFMRAVQDRDILTLEDLLGDDFTLTTGRPGAEVRTRRWVKHPDGWRMHARHAQPIEGD